MKKFLAATLSLACILGCALSFTSCGSLPTYYGKTVTLTGAALPIHWDKACTRDNRDENIVKDENGYVMENGTFKYYDKKEYSYRQLVKKYWDGIDFTNQTFDGQVNLYAGLDLANADDLIACVNGQGGTAFNACKNYSFRFGSKSEKTCVISDGTHTYTGVVAETQSEFDAAMSKADGVLNGLQVFGFSTPGRDCCVLMDTDGNGNYDSYANIHLTRYVVNGDKDTMELHLALYAGKDEDNNDQMDYYSFQNEAMKYQLWRKPQGESGHNAFFTFPFYPEIVLTDNK